LPALHAALYRRSPMCKVWLVNSLPHAFCLMPSASCPFLYSSFCALRHGWPWWCQAGLTPLTPLLDRLLSLSSPHRHARTHATRHPDDPDATAARTPLTTRPPGTDRLHELSAWIAPVRAKQPMASSRFIACSSILWCRSVPSLSTARGARGGRAHRLRGRVRLNRCRHANQQGSSPQRVAPKAAYCMSDDSNTANDSKAEAGSTWGRPCCT
jgi:hypothetical protein